MDMAYLSSLNQRHGTPAARRMLVYQSVYRPPRYTGLHYRDHSLCEDGACALFSLIRS
jgi:hypothetical protein